MGQILLFPDPKPLDERLGAGFFQNLPRRTGVYLMKDSQDRVIYVGKAKDLRQRLNHYRLANPDRMARRHLRMVREVARIELQFCGSEAAALKCESELLRLLKPKFNRVGVWPGKTWFILWQARGSNLALGVAETAEDGWHQYGPDTGRARRLWQSICRLLWLALSPEASIARLPAGWAHGRLPETVQIDCRAEVNGIAADLSDFLRTKTGAFHERLALRLSHRQSVLERTLIEDDLESLQRFTGQGATEVKKPGDNEHQGI